MVKGSRGGLRWAIKKPAIRGGLAELIETFAGSATGALELVGELLDAAGGVHEALLTGVSRVGVHRHVTHDNEIVLAIDLLLAGRLHGGLGQETLARRDIEEANVIESGMSFGFHGKKE